MEAIRPFYRLIGLVCLSALLGFLVLRTPGLMIVEFPDGTGSITLPQSLEGWRMKPGHGNLLLTGETRLGLVKLEVERTPVSEDDQPGLQEFIGARHQQLFTVSDDYQARLRGEYRRFGLNTMANISRAVWDDRLPLIPVRGQVVQHDVYWKYQGSFLRVGMHYPLILERYINMDQYILAAGLKSLQ